uniref:Uncharacterized protein n=1 Tax=Trichogramma kaykai TaxID=54128 RepID=A0ABD2XI73_9HYME
MYPPTPWNARESDVIRIQRCNAALRLFRFTRRKNKPTQSIMKLLVSIRSSIIFVNIFASRLIQHFWYRRSSSLSWALPSAQPSRSPPRLWPTHRSCWKPRSPWPLPRRRRKSRREDCSATTRGCSDIVFIVPSTTAAATYRTDTVFTVDSTAMVCPSSPTATTAGTGDHLSITLNTILPLQVSTTRWRVLLSGSRERKAWSTTRTVAFSLCTNCCYTPILNVASNVSYIIVLPTKEANYRVLDQLEPRARKKKQGGRRGRDEKQKTKGTDRILYYTCIHLLGETTQYGRMTCTPTNDSIRKCRESGGGTADATCISRYFGHVFLHRESLLVTTP